MNNNINSLGYLLNKSSRLIKGKLNDPLKQLGLTSSQLALLKDIQIQEEIGSEPINFTPACIAERLNSDRPTVSGIIERLSKKSLISINQNPTDRRSQIIELTDKSRELLPELENISIEAEQNAIKGLTDKEVEILKVLLRRIITNMID